MGAAKSMKKLEALEQIIGDKDKFILAFSGGLDSAFLALYLKKLGREFIAVTIDNGMLPDVEYVKEEAKRLGIEHSVVEIDLFGDRAFSENTEERCYFCKKEIIKALNAFKSEVGYDHVIDASNRSDLADYRAGIVALHERGILTPLLDAEIEKEDIIRYSKEFNLEERTPQSCLATRVPIHARIRKPVIERIRQVENEITKLGLTLVRAKVHDRLLRIQVLESEMEKALKNRDKINEIAREAGFAYVTIDLEPYEISY
jgi:uncharacterized protein